MQPTARPTGDRFLAKPHSAASLVRTIGEVLGKRLKSVL